MNEELKKSIKEHAEKYGLHYVREFVAKTEDRPILYEDHYKVLKFGKTFFYELLYEDRSFQDYLGEKRRELFHQLPNEEELDQAVDELERQIMNETNKHYKKYYMELYLEFIDERIEEMEEELNYAKEDELYYINRAYLQEEDEYGGNITEEQRTGFIKEHREKQKTIQAKIDNLNQVKKEIERLHENNENKITTGV